MALVVRMDTRPRQAGRRLALAGLVLVAAGAWFGFRALMWVDGAEHVDGIVVELIGDEESLTPVVEYEVGERRYRIEGREALPARRIEAGERRGVYHAPDDPADAAIDDELDPWTVPVSLGALGAALLAAGAAVGLLARRAEGGGARLRPPRRRLPRR